MNTSNDPYIESVLRKQVLDVSTLVSAGEYSKALSTMRRAKAIHPKNIFIIAIEKQLEKLLALSQSSPLSDPNRIKELLDSLPTLIQHAVEGMKTEEPLPPSVIHEEREVAFAKLKDEYFQLADGYIMNGEYNQALLEIKRVLILEPESIPAREYQQKIQDLLHLKEQSEAKRSAAPGEKVRPDMQPIRYAQEKAPEAKRPVRKVSPQVPPTGSTRTKPDVRVHVFRSKTFTIGVIPIFVALLIATYFLARQSNTEQNSAIDSSPATNTIATNATENNVPKPNPVQAAPIPTTIEAQPSADTITNGAQPSATRMDTITAEKLQNRSGTIADASSPATVTGPRPIAELPKSGKETSTTPLRSEEPKSETKKTSSKNLEPQEPKTQEPKAATSNNLQLTKLTVKPGTTGTRTNIETPAIVDPLERKAQIIHLVNPKFPEAAQRTGLQGEVLVGVQIGPDGKPIQAKILRSSSAVFNNAVIEAVMRSTYSAGVMSNGPVTSWITFPFSFKIKKN